MTSPSKLQSKAREANGNLKSIGVCTSMLFSLSVFFLASTFTLLLASSGYASTRDSLNSVVSLEEVRSGIHGTWKVGYDTAHRVRLKATESGIYSVEIETVDGDGIRVQYRSRDWQAELEAAETRDLEVLAKHGRAQHPIRIRVLRHDQIGDVSGQLLIEHELTAEERGVVLDSDQPWVVGIGSEQMSLDSAMLRSARSNTGDYAVTELAQVSQLPIHSAAYSGVDLLVFSTSNTQLLEQMTAAQAEAIRDWIWQGGRSWLTLGSGAESWFKHQALAALVPGVFAKTAEQCNPGPLESFLNSQARLEPYSSAIIELPVAAVELTGVQVDRARYPLLARWSAGAGKIRFLATEIDSPNMKSWDSQVALIKLMLSDAWEGRGVQNRTLSLAQDLSIQLNQTLDRFEGLKMSSLAQLCAILFVLLCILGPFDYFLIAKKWRMPRATWLTLTLTSLVACVGLAVVQKQWKPRDVSLNSLEFVDVDTATRTVSGHAYTRFYGGPRGLYGIHNTLADTAIGNAPIIELNWMGQPGKGLGGFESTVATDRLFPEYRINRVTRTDRQNDSLLPSDAVLQPAGHQDVVGIEGLGIPESGTKGLESHWEGELAEDASFGALASHAGAIDLLDGVLVNSFKEEIHNGILIYRGRFYSLPLRFKPNDQFILNVSVVPKDFTRRLQRRINIDGKDQGTPWDKNEQDLTRIAEIFSFHRAAAGMTYTGMLHRYLSRMDLSDLMKSERAILLGELNKPQLNWEVARNAEPLTVGEGNSATIVRVLLPVAPPTIKQPSAREDGLTKSE